MSDTDGQVKRRGTGWCRIGSWFCGLGLGAVLVGLAGVQADLLSPIAAFGAFGIGLLVCAVAVLLLIVGLALSKGSGGLVAPGRAWGALLAGGLLIGLSLALRPDTGGAPPIHDLTTDLSNPPAFDRMIAIREADGAQNPPEYAGPETAEAQQAAFPDLKTLVLSQPRDQVFAAAEASANELGWEIIASDKSMGRIEATDTTSWFRFRDDVVIRISSSADGTAVDVRSKSRVGMGDMGANAARIRRFLDALTQRLG